MARGIFASARIELRDHVISCVKIEGEMRVSFVQYVVK